MTWEHRGTCAPVLPLRRLPRGDLSIPDTRHGIKVSVGGDSAGAVPAQPSFPELEAGILWYWQADRTFPASAAAGPAGENGSNEFVLYDGPPFANGLPHYGHLLTGYVRDIVPRYQTMRGRRVERRFGWDCHGRPTEVAAERQLGITHKSEIEHMGVTDFNAACHDSVPRHSREWRDYVTRQARWVDFDNDYKTLDDYQTLDLDYMESVLWAFKTLTKFRDRMVALNQQITWVPDHVRDGQFGRWLEGARDWSIPRNRYRGSPIPVRVPDDPAYPRVDVYGSLDEMERDFGVRPTDLHRPFVDQPTRPDPGDFIVAYNARTRGWCYILHVLATALFDMVVSAQ